MSEKKLETLADRLTHAMQRAKLSQSALARKADVSQPTIWRMVKGKAESSREIDSIAHALEVNSNWLAKGLGSMEASTTFAVDNSRLVPIWEGTKNTGEYAIVPNGKAEPHWKSFIIASSGCKEIPAGSLVISDDKLDPNSDDYVVAMIKDKVSVYKFISGVGEGYLTVDDERVTPVNTDSEDVKLLGTVVFFVKHLRR